VAERYPSAVAAILGGSAVRGEGSETSDLDLLVVIDELAAPYRESFVSHGWPVEAFVNNPSSYRFFFEQNIRRRRPSLPQMCAEGVVLVDDMGVGAHIKEEAEALVAAGPAPLSTDELDSVRYRVTDLLDDFIGARTMPETYFTATELVLAASDLLLGTRGRWLASSKWIDREIRRLDKDLADRLVSSLEALFRAGDRTPLVSWVEGALAQAGGRLFEGYRQEGPRESTKRTPEVLG